MLCMNLAWKLKGFDSISFRYLWMPLILPCSVFYDCRILFRFTKLCILCMNLAWKFKVFDYGHRWFYHVPCSAISGYCLEIPSYMCCVWTSHENSKDLTLFRLDIYGHHWFYLAPCSMILGYCLEIPSYVCCVWT
jgi:hypothetical protein